VNAALLQLLLHETRGELHRLWRRLRTWKGALAGLAIVAFFAALIVLRWLSTELIGDQARVQGLVTPERVEAFGPLITCALAIPAGLSGRALYFRPSEIDWLFPAPVLRRDLVLYNVLWRARISLVSALWIALLLWIPGVGYGQQVVGCALWLLFSQIASQLLSVMRAWATGRLAPSTRLVGYGLLAGGLVAGAVLTYGSLSATGGAGFLAFAETPFVRALTWPARPAFEVFAADTFAERVLWSALGFGVLAVMVWLLCQFDFGIREAGLQRSRQIKARIRQMRAGGGALAGAPRAGMRVPVLPFMGGVGPLAWRQTLELVRNPRAVLTLVFMVALSAGAVIAVSVLGLGGAVSAEGLAWASVGAIVMAGTTANQSLALDFRRDLDRMALLKSLPIAPVSMAIGQLAVATAFLVCVQALAIGAIAVFTGGFSLGALVAIAFLLVPASWVNVCLDNLIFLWMPHRTVIEDPGDVGFAGRLMAMMLLKLLALAAVAGLGLGVGFASHLALGSVGLAAAAVTLVLLASCVPFTLAVARAFRRFRL